MATAGEVYLARVPILTDTVGFSRVLIVSNITFIPGFVMLDGVMILD